MLLDLRVAVRALARSPAFATGAVLTLALALGLVTTAVGLLFGAVGGAGPSSATEPLVLQLIEWADGREQRMRWPYAAVEIMRAQARSFDRVATYTTATVNFSGGAEGERLDIELVSPHYFEILGVDPSIGRRFSAMANDRAPGPDEVLISDAFWRRSFGAARDVVGRTVRLSQRPATIVGVLPPGFRGLSGRAHLLVPHTLAPVLTFDGYFTSDEYFHNVIARRAGGVSIEQARSELALIASGVADRVPPRSDAATARSAALVPLSDAQTNPQTIRARLLIAMGAVCVLLIAAVNVGNLVAARMAGRQREFALRRAVGASRARVFRAMAVEMSLVTAAGLGVAFLVATWARDLVTTLVPAGLVTPANDYGQVATFAGLRLDGPVAIAVGVLALGTMVLISVVACRPVFRGTLSEIMKQGSARGGFGPGRGQRMLLTVQVALSIALLASAGLLFRTVSALGTINPGFDATNVIALSVAEDLAVQRPGAGPVLVERIVSAVSRVPGVVSATAAQCTPYGTRCARLPWRLENDTRGGGDVPFVGWHRVGPNHFSALGIPVVRGRGFTAEDRRGRAPVLVINAEAARRLFPDRDPIGQRVRLPEVIEGDPDVAEIVGIVGNVVYWPLDESPGADVYQPALQFSHPWTTVMVRTAGEPASSLPALRAAMRQADPNLPPYDIVTLEQLGAAGQADRRFLSALLAACAGLGLLLAVVGVYAMTASWMAARRRELGLHVALGAEPQRLVRLVMRSTLLQTGLGLGAGIVVALGAGRLLSSVLFGVDPHDPRTLILAAAVMTIASVVAAYMPARRALSVDPVRELNSE
jgi:putative ABC transport system permease protein